MATTSGGDVHAARPTSPTLTVAAVARRLGVAPSTLRTWDRRYGLGPSEHTAGSHRRYTGSDLARLVVMRRLILEGVPSAEAARLATSGLADDDGAVAPVVSLPGHLMGGGAHPAPRAGGAERPSDADADGEDADDDGPGLAGALVRPGLLDHPDPADSTHQRPDGWPHRPTNAERARAGGGRVIALPEGSPAARGLARAAMSLDSHEVTRLLRDAVRTHGVVRAWDTVVLPVLVAVGERWRATGEGVDVEHALSECVVGVMRGIAASLHRPRNTRPVVLGCAEGDHHTLALHVLAAALAEEDVSTRMFGVGMPPEALLSAVRRIGPSVVFLFARLPAQETAVLGEIPRQRPAPRVVVGGRGWDPDGLPRSARLVTSLGEAVDEIVAAASL